MSRADELLAMLQTPVPDEHKPQTWRGAYPWNRRVVYIGKRSSLWCVTHSGSLPDYELFSSHDVQELIDRGELVPAWPGRPTEKMGYVWRGW